MFKYYTYTDFYSYQKKDKKKNKIFIKYCSCDRKAQKKERERKKSFYNMQKGDHVHKL